MRVLLIGDRRGRLPRLAGLLREAGHVVDRIDYGVGALRPAAQASAGLLLLDLASVDGPPALAIGAIRRWEPLAPLLALDASDDSAARVVALDAGADDCIGAHQADAELLARLRVWHRRGMGGAEPVVTVGPLAFDTRERTMALDRRALALSHREICLLEALMRRAGRFVSVPTLVEQLYEWSDAVTPNSIQVYVCRLRRKIVHPALSIQTARGLGYSLTTDAPR